MRHALPADIALGEELELVGLKDGAGAFAVLNMEGKGGLAARTGEERVGGVDVALGLQEGSENGLEIGGAAGKFHDDEGNFGESEAVFLEEDAGLVGVVGDETDDGGVGRVENTEGNDVDSGLRKHLHNIEQAPDFVFHEDRKLFHLIFLRSLGGLKLVRFHLHSHADGKRAERMRSPYCRLRDRASGKGEKWMDSRFESPHRPGSGLMNHAMPRAKKLPVKDSQAPKALSEVARQQLLLINGLLDEVGRNYLARLRREITELVRCLEKKRAGDGFSRRELKDLRGMLKQIAHLQINPDKGRRKDLKKIDSLIGELQSTIERW